MNVLNLSPIIQLTDEQFYTLCQANPELKLERNARGDLIMNPPTGGQTGRHNANLIFEFVAWNRKTQLGEVFDSSTCFKLPNGSDRSPDIAWIEKTRWHQLTPDQQEKFPPIAPDFVLELMSPTDTLKTLQEKLQEYLDNGVKLGWLINRKARFVEVYEPHQPVKKFPFPATLTGGHVLPGFSLTLDWL
ncbi:MAG: Uma2 family endonuclease [Oscillatoriales cyanobacterium RM2_1_1]|nr:Uma2 family endonuclease [Oscillatoriales cyanobacterium SM2_3_0]NJO47347.1 Uma2 family endonuclease [Oscillatoriales cyanobacterium RM2_1_1]